MKNVKTIVLYTFILFLELFRSFSLIYFEKINTSFVSFFDFMGFAVFCLPAVLLFLILSNEKRFYKFLKLIAFIKIFSLAGGYLYFSSLAGINLNLVTSSYMQKLVYYIVLPFIIFGVDLFMLIFSLLKEQSLCKSYQ